MSPRPLGLNDKDPRHPLPHPFCLDPDTRFGKHAEGGSVSFCNGIPVYHWKSDSPPRFGLDEHIPSQVDELKKYLELELRQAANSARRRAAWEMLEEIRLDCWSWFFMSREWEQGTFCASLHKQGITEKDFLADLEAGRAALLEIYPSFSGSSLGRHPE